MFETNMMETTTKVCLQTTTVNGVPATTTTVCLQTTTVNGVPANYHSGVPAGVIRFVDPPTR